MSIVLPIDRTSSRYAAATASITYALLLSSSGVYLPFFPVWLTARGYDPMQIGLLLAIPTLMRVFASAPFARIGDGFLGPRRTFLMMGCGTALGYAGLPLMPGFWSLAAMMVLMSAFLAPTAPLLDVIVLQGVNAHGHDYGRIRTWGSLFWLLAAIGAGKALTVLPIGTVPPVLALLSALTVIVGLALPDDRKGFRRQVHESAAGVAADWRHFAVLVAGIGCLQGAHSFLYSFATLIWQADGFSSTQIGALWAVGTVLETLLFLGAGSLAGRLGPYRMITIGGMAGLVRWTLMGLEPSSGLAIAGLQAMHGLTFACVHLGMMAWLARFERGRAARMGMAASVVGAGLAAGTAIAGVLYGALGPHGFLAMAGVAALGLALVGAAWAMERRRPAVQPQSAASGGNTVLPS